MISPASEAELASVISEASGPLAIRGGGTQPVGHPVDGEVLTTTGLAGITLHEPGALTLVARAGTPLTEVEATLAAEGQRLPFEPMDHRALLGTDGNPTIGGAVAANLSGPRRLQAGACRDSLIGVRFVDGTGTVLKNGGRVMKNVTGYDLVKLMAGSRGTLGVLTELSFKVLPKPDSCLTLVIHGLDDTTAVKALSVALGSPYEVTGAAHLPSGRDGTAETLIRIEGFGSSVEYRAGRLEALLGGCGEVTRETDRDAVDALWRAVRDVTLFAGKPGNVWRISVKPSDGPRVAAALPDADVLFDWGGGLVWVLLEDGRDIRPALDGIGGHATLVRVGAPTPSDLPRFHPEPAPLAALSSGLRARFDPRGILNPGLMG